MHPLAFQLQTPKAHRKKTKANESRITEQRYSQHHGQVSLSQRMKEANQKVRVYRIKTRSSVTEPQCWRLFTASRSAFITFPTIFVRDALYQVCVYIPLKS